MSWTKSSAAVQAAAKALASSQQSPMRGKQIMGKDRLCLRVSTMR